MKIVVIVVAAIVLGLLVVLAFLKWWIQRKAAAFVNSLQELGELFDKLGDSVPPFRITLDKNPPDWTREDAVDALTKVAGSHGYETVGDFVVPELNDLPFRALVNAASRSYAVIYDHPTQGVWAEVVCKFDGGREVSATHAKLVGVIDRPDWAELRKVELDLVANPGDFQRLHEEVVRACAGRTALPVTASGFEASFVEAYARAQDWRIDRGGVSADEIRRTATATGEPEPSQEQIEMIQEMWRAAISEFIEEQVMDVVPKQFAMSQARWKEIQERLYIVHEGKDRASLVTDLACLLVDEEDAFPDDDEDDEDFELDEEESESPAMQEARQAVERAFASAKTLREGFASVMKELPEEQRMEKLGAVEGKYPADVYLMPEFEDDDFDDEDN